MSATAHRGKFLHPRLLFTAFKYTIYLLLAVNTVMFFQEDLAASAETFGGEIRWHNLAEAFTAAMDTGFWLVLLLLFELETAVIPDEKLQGGLRWSLSAVRVICYGAIVWCFYGYVTKYLLITNVAPISIADVCSLVGGNWAWVADFDDYPTLDAVACAGLQGQKLLLVSGTNIIGSRAALDAAGALAVIDIVNAATWLVIVALLEAEVWLQVREGLTGGRLRAMKFVKSFFYTLLFICAIYWWLYGDFLDFWDAFLWLVAFIFIEMNIFQWHEDAEEAAANAVVAR